jgi:asparaginyl-tRNA synthetase
MQAVELRATEVVHFGLCDSASYPMAKKFLREKAHLRARTNIMGAVSRVRNQLAFATHQFFQQHGFLYVHTPIITASDCEGAGEMFQVRPTHACSPCMSEHMRLSNRMPAQRPCKPTRPHAY